MPTNNITPWYYAPGTTNLFTSMLDGSTHSFTPPSPGPRIMIDCSASAISSIPSNADIICPGPHWSSANVSAALAIATGAVVANICDLNQTGTTSSGVGYFDCDIFDCEIGLGYSTIALAISASVGWHGSHQSAHPGELGMTYEFQGNIPAWITAMNSATRSAYNWPADHSGTLHSYVYTGSPPYPTTPNVIKQVATQWEGTQQTGTIDVSTVTDNNWFVSYQLRKPFDVKAGADAMHAKAKEQGGYRVDCSNSGWTRFATKKEAHTYADKANGLKKVRMPAHPHRRAAWRELAEDGTFTGGCDHSVSKIGV